MTNPMLHLLEDAQKKQFLVSLYFDPSDASEIAVGYVNWVTNSFVRLKAVNMYGEDDGWEVVRLQSLYMVRSNGIYERKIQHLKTKIDVSLFEEVHFEKDKEDNLIQSTLLQAKSKNVIVRLYNSNGEEMLRGFVNEVVADAVTLNVVDNYGVFADGIGIIQLEEVDRLHCNCKEDKALAYLCANFK